MDLYEQTYRLWLTPDSKFTRRFRLSDESFIATFWTAYYLSINNLLR